jgi:hypothetical protein
MLSISSCVDASLLPCFLTAPVLIPLPGGRACLRILLIFPKVGNNPVYA